MKLKNVVLLGLVLLLLSIPTFALSIKPVEASGTIYIRYNGSVDPPANITSADGVTYTFTDNNYDSVVVLRNNIVVDGAGYVLQGSGSGNGFYLNGIHNVTIRNTEIKGFEYGVFLEQSSSNTISGNNITDNNLGLKLDSSSNYNAISENNIADNRDWGIFVLQSLNCTIAGNNLRNNNKRGILITESSNNNIFENTLVNEGLQLISSHGNVVESNSVNRKPLVYLEDMSDQTVENAGQVILVNCNRMRVENLNLSNTTIGVELYGTNSTKIGRNNITNNMEGIGLSHSFNNTVAGNSVADYEEGIFLGDSSDNNVDGNNLEKGLYGVYLSSSSSNSIVGNSITKNIRPLGSSTLGSGILLLGASGNTFSGNNLANNWKGVDLAWSSNNKFYHNNFLNNSYSHANVYTTGYANFWDNAVEGNYWDDYNGTDSDNDGIGDTPHVIGDDNQDNYPLMGMFSDFKATSEHHVQTICNSTISDFLFEYFPPSEFRVISFNVMGEDGTTGFCRIRVPTALMDKPYTVLVNGTEVPYDLLSFSNQTHSYLYFTYNHSKQEVIIIPEFPAWIPMLLMVIVLTFAIAFYKGRLLKTLVH